MCSSKQSILASTELPSDLLAAIRDVYEPAGMRVTDAPWREAESAEYEACRFGLNGHTVVFRVAKTTPTKTGQFVTLWKRPIPSASIAPLDIADGVAFVVVSVFDAKYRGQFVLPQKLLVAKKIMSRNGRSGKRAIRVYPPWSKPEAKEAIKTQQWQLRYFLPFEPGGSVDAEQVSRLFSVRNVLQ